MDRQRIPKKEDFDKGLQSEILRKMLLRLSNKLDKSIGSFAFDLLSPVSIKLAQLDVEGDEIINKLFIKNLTGDDLELKIYELTGATRKDATYASGLVTITGQPGTIINKGILVASENVRFEISESAIIPDKGSIDVIAISEISGSEGNVGAEMIRFFPVTIQGLETVTNKEAFVNGFDAESDEELYRRYLDIIQHPAASGNQYHYMLWAKEVEGVGEVRVQPAEEMGLGNVRVLIVDRNGDMASEELVDNVYKHIEKNRPIGATVSVATGVPKDIKISAKLKLTSDVSLSSVTRSFESALSSYKKDITFKEDLISYAKINSLLFGIDGVLDVSDLKLNGDVKNIDLEKTDIPMFDNIELTEIQG